LEVDLVALACAVGQRLHAAHVSVTPDQSERYARALQLAKPRSRDALYLTTRAIFVTDVDQLETFDGVFAEIFGAPRATDQDGVALDAVRTPTASRA